MDNQCSICHKKNNQLLMLSCGHDPCIDCAASHYFTAAQYRKQFQHLRQANYWCQICDEPTIIDQSSIQQLLNYAGISSKYQGNTIRSEQTIRRSKSYQRTSKNENQVFLSPNHRISTRKQSKEKKKQAHRHHHGKKGQPSLMVCSQQFKPPHMIGHTQYNESGFKQGLKHHHSGNNFLFQSNRTNSSSAHPPCPKHCDEILSYYCFTCSCSICVECALHGSHIGHQVEAIKKAGNRLKANYQKLVSQSQKHRTSLQNNLKEIDKMINNYRTLNDKHRTKIKEKFAELVEMLAEKQNSILLQIDNLENENLNALLQLKYKYDDNLNLLKMKCKKFKYCLNVQPVQWNMSELEAAKNQLKIACENNLSQNNLKKIEHSIKQVDTQLMVQALDTISDLVSTFKVEAHNKNN